MVRSRPQAVPPRTWTREPALRRALQPTGTVWADQQEDSMDLMIGLAAVDRVTGDKQMQQLANGWMGWESQRGRRLRALSARVLVALARRLAPEPIALPEPSRVTTSLSA
jgi:hypothetical protein